MVYLPGKIDANREARLGDLVEVIVLLGVWMIVFRGDEVNLNFYVFVFVLSDGFQKLHQITCLEELPNVGIGNRNIFGTYQVGSKQVVKGYTTLIFLEY